MLGEMIDKAITITKKVDILQGCLKDICTKQFNIKCIVYSDQSSNFMQGTQS